MKFSIFSLFIIVFTIADGVMAKRKRAKSRALTYNQEEGLISKVIRELKQEKYESQARRNLIRQCTQLSPRLMRIKQSSDKRKRVLYNPFVKSNNDHPTGARDLKLKKTRRSLFNPLLGCAASKNYPSEERGLKSMRTRRRRLFNPLLGSSISDNDESGVRGLRLKRNKRRLFNPLLGCPSSDNDQGSARGLTSSPKYRIKNNIGMRRMVIIRNLISLIDEYEKEN